MPYRYLTHALAALAMLVGLAAPTLAQPVVDGIVTDASYTTIGTKPNGNAGFGPNFDVQSIRYHTDTDAGVLYLAVEGRIESGSSNGIGLWLGFSELDGRDAGTALTGSGLPHHFGTTGRPFQADFDVDFGIVLNRGGSSNTFADVVRYAGGTSSGFLGTLNPSGAAITNVGGFAAGTVTLAFNAGGGAGQGFEIAIPFAQLGITAADATSTLEAFAYVVSADAYFSDVAVGGAINGGNLGYQPNFSTNQRTPGGFGSPDNGPIGTAPFHTTAVRVGPPFPTGFAFVSPTAGQTYRAGGKLKPVWTTTPDGAGGTVTVTLRKGGVAVATLYNGPTLETPDFGAARYTIPLSIAGGSDYTVYIELNNSPSVNAESAPFTILGGAVSVVSPGACDALTAGQQTTVAFDALGFGSPVTAQVFLRRVGQSGKTLLATETNSDGQVTVTIPGDVPSGSDYFVLVRVSDGTISRNGKSDVFTISGAEPENAAPGLCRGTEVSTREAYLLVATDGLAGEIGVYAGDRLVGSAAVAGRVTEVVVPGADLGDGDVLSLRLVDGASETALDARSVRDETGALAALAFADGVELTVETATGEMAGPVAALVVAVAPNPAAAGTTVRVSQPATVAVYDVLGRRVADLGTVETTARWDARGTAPGVYVVRVTADGATQSVRVTVAR